MRRIISFILLGLLTQSIYGQCALSLGTNLAGPVDYGSEWPFVDIMKYSREWITCNCVWLDEGENPWNTDVLDQIPVDKNGYPLELPYFVAGTETTQVVRTVWANTSELKEGTYVVLYDGQGRLDFDLDMTLVSSEPGRCDVQLTHKDNIASLLILESINGDPVRNIRVLMPGTESTHKENPWCSEWLEKLEPFGTLRFMDWGLTNNSPLTSWENRPQIGDYTYTLRGIPYEWMIDLSNLRQSDAWVCVPHQADDTYIRNMAQLFRDQLDPSLKIYVEYSNEIWNWMFDQTDYCYEHGDQNVAWPERIAPFIQNCMDIWSEVFEGQTDRMIRVVGVQHAWQDVSNRIVNAMRAGSFDAFSPAAYFGFTDEGYDALEALGSNATPEEVLYRAREGMLKNSYEWTRSQYQEIASPLNIPMIYYEAGQHLTPDPFGSEQAYNQALMDAQTHPGMYDLYNEWFDSLKTFVPEGQTSLMMHFSFISPKDGRYGSWGALESQFFQSPPYQESAPKYQALLDNTCMDREAVPEDTKGLSDFSLDQNHPNPFNPNTTIRFKLQKPGHVELTVYDMLGREIAVLINERLNPGSHSLSFQNPNLPSGLYVYQLKTGNHIAMRKMILMK